MTACSCCLAGLLAVRDQAAALQVTEAQEHLDALKLEQPELALGAGRDGRHLGAQPRGVASPLLAAHPRRRRRRLPFSLLLLRCSRQELRLRCQALSTKRQDSGAGGLGDGAQHSREHDASSTSAIPTDSPA